MIIKNTSSPVITSGDMASSKAAISPENSDFIGSLLRDQIYTDKILAPIREFICNALDAKVDSGSSKPVEVRIKANDQGEYIWSVRDFGFGLSEEDVREIFFMYGNSTKRNTNTQVGMLGLGSKSFYAYTDTYYVTSYFGGVKTLYCATLEAGTQGQNVGTLYKVDEEPTTETGIEVSADVSKDIYRFEEKTLKFVRELAPNTPVEYHDRLGNVYKPLEPTKTYSKGGYEIHTYDTQGHSYGSRSMSIRMGGVIYRRNRPIKASLGFQYDLVVDVPIGSLTIPPSREAINDTPTNNRVLQDIDDILEEMAIEDMNNQTLPKFGEYVSKYSRNDIMEGQWCRFHMNFRFKDTYQFRYNYLRTERSNFNNDIKPVNGKYIIYTFPEIRTYRSWVRRLEAVLKADPNYSGYLAVFDTEEVLNKFSKNTDTLDVSDCMFVDVKSLGLPRLVTEKKEKNDSPRKYAVYMHNNCDYYTPDELDELVDDKVYNDPKWIESPKLTRKQLFYKTIAFSTSGNNLNKTGCGRDNAFWSVNAQKMYEGMVALGFVEYDSPEFKKALDEIIAREELQRSMARAQSVVSQELFHIPVLPQVANAVGKNKTKLDKLVMVRDAIKKENSPRGRILKALGNSYNYSKYINREDLRQIMKLK